jgi:signal transduction histidine kinase
MQFTDQSVWPSDGLNLETLMETLFFRDEFLSIASHELKTPLTSIKLQTGVFKRLAKRENGEFYAKEKVDRLVDLVDAQTSRLIVLVEDMLDISRIRSGQFYMTKNHINVSEVVHEAVAKIEQLEAVQISLKVKPDLFACVDRDRILQVFGILLKNGARYGKGLPLQVELTKRKQRIYFTVKDEGGGIEASDQKKIFHRFQRGVPASEVSGLGLGLYIAREIIEAHAGKISVSSKLNSGSTFKVELNAEEVL